MNIIYLILDTTICERHCYGIAAAEIHDGIPEIIDSVLDVSNEIDDVTYLVEICNTSMLDPVHLHDVVSDFASLL